jgi:DNA polymerase-3 subunit gamma/tau
MTKEKYQVLARRYRPKTFSEVVGQEATVTTLKNALRFDKAAHAYLFCGSRGVGKTTLARLFAKALNCLEKGPDMEPCNRCQSCLEIGTGQSLDVIEIDGASNRGIDDIRAINETALYSPSSGRYKIYIIDEVHMLTKEAFNALLKTLEEPPERAKFFFATTEAHKVLPTIISRCQRFDLGRIQLSQMTGKLQEIATDLDRVVEPEALHLIASFSEGSLRDAESLLDQILVFAEKTITAEVVRTALGLISQDHFFALDKAFSASKAPYAFELVETLFQSGKDLPHFYEQLIEHVRNLSLARLLGESALPFPPELSARYHQSALLYASSQCLYLLEYLLRSESQLQKSACQRVALEAILLHYIQSKNRIPTEVLIRRLSEMEEALKAHPGAFPEVREPKPIPKDPSPPPVEVKPALVTLKAVPFNPFKAEVPLEAPPSPISEILPAKREVAPVSKEASARYDTLIRFAAVELEGKLH